MGGGGGGGGVGISKHNYCCSQYAQTQILVGAKTRGLEYGLVYTSKVWNMLKHRNIPKHKDKNMGEEEGLGISEHNFCRSTLLCQYTQTQSLVLIYLRL